jgi:hypothetical protein
MGTGTCNGIVRDALQEVRLLRVRLEERPEVENASFIVDSGTANHGNSADLGPDSIAG